MKTHYIDVSKDAVVKMDDKSICITFNQPVPMLLGEEVELVLQNIPLKPEEER